MNNDSENILFFLNENNEVEETTFGKLNVDNDIDTFLLDFHKDNIHNPSTTSTDYSQETSACKQAYVSLHSLRCYATTQCLRFPPICCEP